VSTLIALTSEGQDYTKCKVFQFAGTDSLKKKLVSEKFYNAQGQLTSYYFKGYKQSSTVGMSDSRHFNFYHDTLLILSTSIDENQDSSKTIYHYNALGQKVREEHFSYERRLRKDSDKGFGRPGGCIVTDKDYDKKRTWAKTSEIVFQYDSSGNKILFDATQLHFTSQNKYTWVYDEQNRIVEHSSYDDSKLIWTERFEYFHGGYEFTRTWYDYDGTPKHLKERNWEYVPQFTFTYELNVKGDVIREQVTTEKGVMTSSMTTQYNSDGRVARTIHFDSKGQPEITHIYQYQ